MVAHPFHSRHPGLCAGVRSGIWWRSRVCHSACRSGCRVEPGMTRVGQTLLPVEGSVASSSCLSKTGCGTGRHRRWLTEGCTGAGKRSIATWAPLRHGLSPVPPPLRGEETRPAFRHNNVPPRRRGPRVCVRCGVYGRSVSPPTRGHLMDWGTCPLTPPAVRRSGCRGRLHRPWHRLCGPGLQGRCGS